MAQNKDANKWSNAEIAAILLIERSGANGDRWEDDIDKVAAKAKQSIVGLAQQLVANDDLIPKPEPKQEDNAPSKE